MTNFIYGQGRSYDYEWIASWFWASERLSLLFYGPNPLQFGPLTFVKNARPLYEIIAYRGSEENDN